MDRIGQCGHNGAHRAFAGAIGRDVLTVDQNDIDRLRTFKTAEPEGRILINGDEGALFNAALYVFDEARKTGFQKIFIETKVRAQGR